MYHVRHFRDAAKAVARERLLDDYQKAGQELEKAGQVLRLFTAEGIAAETPFHEVQETAFSILGRDELSEVADRITGQAGPDEQALQWEHVGLPAPRFKRQLRPIL